MDILKFKREQCGVNNNNKIYKSLSIHPPAFLTEIGRTASETAPFTGAVASQGCGAGFHPEPDPNFKKIREPEKLDPISGSDIHP